MSPRQPPQGLECDRAVLTLTSVHHVQFDGGATGRAVLHELRNAEQLTDAHTLHCVPRQSEHEGLGDQLQSNSHIVLRA